MIDFLTSYKEVISLFLTPLSIIVAIWALRPVTKNAKMNVLKTEFDIFKELSAKEIAFVDYYELPKESIEYDTYNKIKEQYLRVLNLVCLYVLEGYFTKKHFFRSYGKKILLLYEEEILTDTQYPYIYKIYKKYNKKLLDF
ncbi:hypothetical protein [Helicobacter sp.]|uniref:hypothetical protein n=1 Tax=Helicobacter sp. TaxID=218 RepID=UPI0025B9AB8D|nr:hypothetical protein [Helicobacter sp.]MCI5969074.1 hypothetical protein [Helicobacter sp.]